MNIKQNPKEFFKSPVLSPLSISLSSSSFFPGQGSQISIKKKHPLLKATTAATTPQKQVKSSQKESKNNPQNHHFLVKNKDSIKNIKEVIS